MEDRNEVIARKSHKEQNLAKPIATTMALPAHAIVPLKPDLIPIFEMLSPSTTLRQGDNLPFERPLNWPSAWLSKSRCRIDVHGCGHISVTHEFLLHADWSIRLVQKRTVRVPKEVPPDAEQADLLACWL
jgi:hypothetical protein